VLAFNAELRLPASVDAVTREQFVADVLRLLELTPIADSVVGPPGGGLSFEELKRVTIGAEVVANPAIVFLDEVRKGFGLVVDTCVDVGWAFVSCL
jgi:ABC-type multidrug transport system ATPase subunit